MNKTRRYPELNYLKGKIRECNSSYRELAKVIGISPTTLNDKINGYSVFDTEEVNKIVKELNIEPNEVVRIFFSTYVSFRN
ncbi:MULTISPECIES: helix-turn-helix domain-containing protein [Bacillus]|uniref:helix-turn-helix domain-containing protein n=1 Tax=Bacillus TaxID=1386 RepID=UPI001D1F2EC5|nr:helix-turn-helix transcriptional regulator [Bacillus cereus]MBG9616182.1 hypothetical protein [Bacillus cereus]MDF9626891.1 helix-turn-helix transcriptional regulator [Bacillus cereus]